jgi:diguanylate cyclase (GGDEF)-like protein
VTWTSGLAIGAIPAVVLGLFASVLMARAAKRATSSIRAAYQAFGLGLVIAVLGLAVTATNAVRSGVQPSDGQFAPFAIGLAASGSLMLYGLLRLPGIAEPPGSLVRHLTEGLLLASCSVYPIWTLVVDPGRFAYLGAPVSTTSKTLALLALAPGMLVLAVAATVVWRTRRDRSGAGRWSGPGRAAVLLSCVVAAGGGLLITAGTAPTPVIEGVGLVYGLAMYAIAAVVRPANRFGTVAGKVSRARNGTLLAWLPVSFPITACVIRLSTVGSLDNVSVVIAIVIGMALAGRQMLAMRDVQQFASELASRETMLRDLAFTDPLTGLGNRRAFQHVLEQQAMGGPPSVLLSIDLDGFKNINDLRGHDVGDSVLVEVGRRIRTNLRPGDMAARLGGDEFAVLLSVHHEEAVAAANRLSAVLAKPYAVAGAAVVLSASIGLAQCDGAADIADLMRNADLALRFAKQCGKNRVEGYDAAYAQWMRRRTTIEAELHGAIGRSELSVAYQPVVSLPSGRFVGAEALMRWHHPTLGTVSPAEFIPVAEESGQINGLGRWVLQEACRQLSRWLADGYDVWMSVNISVRELHHEEYVSRLAEILRAHHVPPAQIVLEVTEQSIAMDMVELAAQLAALRATGVRIALDDFGAGYSSLGQLRQLPVDVLKIDQSLVAEPAPGPDGSVGPLVDVVARLGQQLGLDVIAEGVVNVAQRAVVEASGCGFAQGELFGWPMPAERFEAEMATDAALPRPRTPENFRTTAQWRRTP